MDFFMFIILTGTFLALICGFVLLAARRICVAHKREEVARILIEKGTNEELWSFAREMNWMNDIYIIKPPYHSWWPIVDYLLMGKIYGLLLKCKSLREERSRAKHPSTSWNDIIKQHFSQDEKALIDKHLLSWPASDYRSFLEGMESTYHPARVARISKIAGHMTEAILKMDQRIT